MAKTHNPTMLAAGWLPATRVAEVISKSLPTVHAMVERGEIAGSLDGGVLYVDVVSLRAHYASQNNKPMVAVVEHVMRTDSRVRRMAP